LRGLDRLARLRPECVDGGGVVVAAVRQELAAVDAGVEEAIAEAVDDRQLVE
jgi:hypothetical protein